MGWGGGGWDVNVHAQLHTHVMLRYRTFMLKKTATYVKQLSWCRQHEPRKRKKCAATSGTLKFGDPFFNPKIEVSLVWNDNFVLEMRTVKIPPGCLSIHYYYMTIVFHFHCFHYYSYWLYVTIVYWWYLHYYYMTAGHHVNISKRWRIPRLAPGIGLGDPKGPT